MERVEFGSKIDCVLALVLDRLDQPGGEGRGDRAEESNSADHEGDRDQSAATVTGSVSP